MVNSFYYFFSATPQVMGGILALFAVFVIFKIQILRSHLLGIGSSLIDYIDPIPQELICSLGDNFSFRTVLKASISLSDVEGLKGHLETIVHPDYLPFKNEFTRVYKSLLRLIRSTIRWSIVTALIILFCLASIPFGSFILNHKCLLFIMYFIIISLSILCFINLILILKKAIYDKM